MKCSSPDVGSEDLNINGVFGLIASDFRANYRNPKGFIICVLYRFAHSCTHAPKYAKPFLYIYILIYKFISEYILGTEIHWRATIGPYLRIYHGYALVVNSNSVIGANVTLRHSVTIGNKSNYDARAPRIENNVEIGAGAILIGSINIGRNSIIGAGAVVVSDVPEGAIMVGNPAQNIIAKKIV